MSRKSKKRVKQGERIAAIGGNTAGASLMEFQEAPRLQSALTAPPNGPASTPARRTWEEIGICALLIILVFGVFGQTLGYSFVNYDDNVNVYETPQVTGGISLHGLAWAFTRTQVDHWDPLTTLSHMADCQLYGLWAGGHHLTNLLLHAAAAVLLFVLLLEMTGQMWRSAFVAAAWAIHPLRVESVAWVTERKDVLSGVFFMLTLLAYLAWTRQPKSKLRYCTVAALFILGLLSKSMLMTLPLVLLLLDYWPLKRWEPGQGMAGWRTAWRLFVEKIPLMLISMTFGLVAIEASRDQMVSLEKAPATQRVGDALATCLAYLKELAWPVDLAVVYTRPAGGLPGAQLALAVAVLGAVTAGGILWRRTHPWLVAGWFWYLGMLVPVMGFFQSAQYPQDDRYTYLPQIGLWIAGTWSVADWAGKWRHRRLVLGSVAAAALCALAIAAWHQTAYWRDSETLWTHALGCTQNNYLAHANLGADLSLRGLTDEAIAQYHAALEIAPDDAETHNNLGNALNQQGQAKEAMAQYREALRIKPAYAAAYCDLGNVLCQQGRTDEAIAQYHTALKFAPDDAETHNDLANALAQQGEAGEAIAEYREALRINPAYAAALCGLGNVLDRQGLPDEAIAEYRAALRSNPGYAVAHYNYGILLFRQGRIDDAIAEYRAGLRINPKYAEAHYDLGKALLREGQTAEAIDQVQQALHLQPANPAIQNTLAWLLASVPQPSLRDGARAVQLATQASQAAGGTNPLFLRTLAAAYAQAGQFSDAVQTAQKALELAEPRSKPLADALRREVKLYEAGRPFEQAP